MSSVRACTIVARNYLPQARVLARSIRSLHPDSAVTVLVLDGDASPGETLFDVLGLEDLIPDPDERQRLAFIYDVTELATAVKPLLLRRLARDDPEGVVLYFDPDVEVFGSLAGLWQATREHSISLVPHVMSPIPDDGRGIDDLYLLRAGVFNLGYIGVGPGSEPFLEWWWGRLRRHCLVEPDRGMFVDQRWADYVPVLFPHVVVRDPGCDVAYWNLHARVLRRVGSLVEVNGQPLRFFHFSGFDPRVPYLLSRHQGACPRVLLSERPLVRELCRAYADKLLRAGWAPLGVPYAFARLPDGTPIDLSLRRLYRQALVEAERLGRPLPPLPFDENALVDWLNEPSETAPLLSRFLFALREMRPDLKVRFPEPHGDTACAYLGWARTADEVPPALRPVPEPTGRAEPAPAKGGLNIVGYLRAELGVGEVARSLAASARDAAIGVRAVLNPRTLSRQGEAFDPEAAGPPYRVTLVCANADELPRTLDSLPRSMVDGCHRIGFWFWETEELPERFRPAAERLDEIWAASEYVASAVRRVVDTPVHVCPVPLRPPAPAAVARERLGLPEGYLFLFLFDFLSVRQRKNPLGLIDAFSRAFRPGEGPRLVLKSINGHIARADLEAVHAAAQARPDVVVKDGYLSREERDALIGHADCYVSLHRSEGFGLTLAEAMAQGKPTIATAYSGNLAFMTPENSFLVPWRPSLVPPGCGPYPEGHRWADPDLDAAADLMRAVHDSPDLARERGARGRADVRERLAPERTAAFVRGRLEAIERPVEVHPETDAALATPRPRAPTTSLDTVAHATLETEQMLQNGIPFQTPSPWGLPGRVLRAAVLRILRPYVEFQRQVHERHLSSTARLVDEMRGLGGDDPESRGEPTGPQRGPRRIADR